MKTNEKTLIRALKGETLSVPPIWLMRQAGRYLPEYRETRKQAGNFLDLCYTPDLAIEVTMQPIRRYDLDASIMFSDILVVPDALGQQVAFKEGEGPVLDPIQNVDALKQLKPEGVLDYLKPVFETIKGLRRELPKDKTLIGFAGSPWTVAIYMVEGRGGTDGGTARGWAYREPDSFSRLIDILIEATTQYLITQVDSGVEVLQLFDSWSGVLSEDQFRKWSIEPTRKIVEGVRAAHPNVPIIGFPRGGGLMAAEYIKSTGVNGISLDANAPLEWARDTLQPLATLQGNLDNQLLVAGGDEMDNTVRRIVDTLGRGPFIFNLGHGIVPQTPPEHVARVVELVRGNP
jgi:uroporphyrinogen decarboxylase